MEYRKKYYAGYNLHLIKTDKFKMCHIAVIFRNKVNVNDITKRQFLVRLLCENSINYPTRRKLLLKLEDLYGASIYGNSIKDGNIFISDISVDYLNPKYTEKEMTKETIKTLFDVIFNPNVNIREFDNKTFNLIKERLRDNINIINENPKRLSVINALSKLKDSPSAYGSLGTISDLEDITPENLYAYYEEMMRNDYVDIFAIGDIDMDEVEKYVCEYAKFKTIKNHDVDLFVQNKKIKEINASDDFRSAQSNISIVLNLNDLTPYEQKYIANIYNMILGGGSLQTKLYRKLREENSLCYSVNSVYEKYDGLILITTGVDANANDKAIKLIKESIKEMGNNISDKEIMDAKELIITSLNYIKDDLGRIVDNYYFEDLKALDDLETRIKTYKNITREEIYSLAKKISISVVYTLAGGNHEEN